MPDVKRKTKKRGKRTQLKGAGLGDAFKWFMKKVGDATVATASRVEPVTRSAVFETLKQTVRTVKAAPVTTFALLAINDPAGALNLAIKAASIGLGAISIGAKVVYAIYKWLSPTERRKQAIAASEMKLDNLDVEIYLQENVDALQELLNTHDANILEHFNHLVGELLEACLKPNEMRNKIFLRNFRNKILSEDSLQTMVMRVALTQATTIANQEEGKQFLPNFNFKNYQNNAMITLTAMQNLIISDVSKRAEQERSLKRMQSELEGKLVSMLEHAGIPLSQASPIYLNSDDMVLKDETAAEEEINPQIIEPQVEDNGFADLERRLQRFKKKRDDYEELESLTRQVQRLQERDESRIRQAQRLQEHDDDSDEELERRVRSLPEPPRKKPNVAQALGAAMIRRRK